MVQPVVLFFSFFFFYLIFNCFGLASHNSLFRASMRWGLMSWRPCLFALPHSVVLGTPSWANCISRKDGTWVNIIKVGALHSISTSHPIPFSILLHFMCCCPTRRLSQSFARLYCMLRSTLSCSLLCSFKHSPCSPTRPRPLHPFLSALVGFVHYSTWEYSASWILRLPPLPSPGSHLVWSRC